MQKHLIAVTDERGNAVESYTVAVYLADTQTLATIYSDDGVTTKANPFSVSSTDGETSFYAPNGEYDYDITNGPAGMNDETVTGLLLYDYRDGSVDDLTDVTMDGNTIDFTGSVDHDILGYDAASSTWQPMTALELSLDDTFARVDARTDGWFWVRRGSPDPDAVAMFTQQGAGHIVDFRQGTGDGSVVAHITNSGGADFAGDVIIGGNLTVNGTTTTVNSTEVEIGDNIIILNSGETGTPSQDAGLEIERGTATNVQLIWDESADRWTWEDTAGAYHTIPGLDVAETVAATWDFTGITVGGTAVVLESRTITAGTGLQGGGKLSANRTLSLDINGLTAEATVDGANDYVVMYDASIGAHRKVLAQDLADSGGTGLTTGDLYVNGGTIPEVDHAATISNTWDFTADIYLNDVGTSNPNLFFEDSGSRRGVLYWNRSANEMELRSYATDGVAVQSQLKLGNNRVDTLNPLYENGNRVATLAGNEFSGKQNIFRSGGGAKDYLHLRDGTDGADLVFYYNGSNYEVRSEQGGGGVRYLHFAQDLEIDRGVSIAFGMSVAGSANVGQLQVGGGATISKVFSVTKSVASKSISAHSCVDFSDTTISGVQVGDVVVVERDDGNLLSETYYSGRVKSADTVATWVCNIQATGTTTTSGTLRITVFRF